MTERTTYEEIKGWFLEFFYKYCYGQLDNKKLGLLSHPCAEEMYFGAIAYAYEQYESAFDLPIENLMLNIQPLILTAGYASEKTKNYYLNLINKILSENSLDELTSDLDEDEKRHLLRDLTLLDLI